MLYHTLLYTHQWVRLLLLLSAITIFHQQAGAQQGAFKGKVTGQVADSSNLLPLAGATVLLMQGPDSATVAYATTDTSGRFSLSTTSSGAMLLGISFTGFRPWFQQIILTDKTPELELNTLALVPDTNQLEDVLISRPPVSIKNDTIEFRASAFKTAPNATVEDLLKKLPGVEVDREGNITAQGEEITRIYVDGKEFFSNDPKLATKNLTAELIESIQVFDDMSDQAKFTRIDDGSRTRTINIKLKKDRKKGVFGRATAGLGSQQRYSSSLSANAFNEQSQYSVLASANNVNRLGFSQTDLDQSLSSGNQRGGGNNRNNARGGNTPNTNTALNGDGNTKSWSAGVNYRDEWGRKTTVGGSYFVSNTLRQVQGNRARTNFFPNDSSSQVADESLSRNNATNHNINLRVEVMLDSMNSLLFTPNIRWGNNESYSFDTLQTDAIGKFGTYQAIVGSALRQNNRTNSQAGNNLLYRHRFKKPGRTFTLGWNTAYSQNEGDGLNKSLNNFYNPDGSLRRTQDIRQIYFTEGNAFNNTLSTSFTEMLGTGKILELNYAYTNNQSTSNRVTYDYNRNTGKFDSLNKQLTNYFENSFISSRLGTNFRVKKQKMDWQVGGAVQRASLQNMSRRAITGKDSLMRQQFTNFFPNASFNYQLGTRKNIRFQYRGSTRAPNINQLQDVVDNSNPLRWRTGNPNLKQEFTNNFNFSFNTFNTKTFLFFNANVQANLISNRIVSSIDTVSSTVQIIKPENVNGAQSFSASGTLGIPLKKVASGRRSPMNLNLTTNLRYGREVSLLLKQVNFNYNTSIGQRVAFNYNVTNKLDINASAAFNYNDARYSVQERLNNTFFTQRYGLDATAYFAKRLTLHQDVDVLVNRGRADGFNQTVPLWNASVGWLLFKRQNGELKFSAFDLLNQNKNIYRNVGDNFIEDTYTNVLRRFYMVTFMLSLNRFGGKPAPAGPPSRGNNLRPGGGGGSRPGGGPGGGVRNRN